uniref:Uncharacterized protein n=1 Tax=Anguilla anguilla TaxID=7936 RepID=A0A0E9U3N0_ANGAN
MEDKDILIIRNFSQEATDILEQDVQSKEDHNNANDVDHRNKND